MRESTAACAPWFLPTASTEAQGHPLPGFTLADCAAVTYDSPDRVVAWKDGGGVTALASRPARLRRVLRGANVFSFRFE